MRFGAVLLLFAVSLCTFADDMPKFHYLAGFTDVQVLKVNHRGIQILHSSGSCYLTLNDLNENDQRRLAKEIEIFKARKKEFDAQQIQLKKQRAAEDKKKKAELKKQTDAQNKEINDLIKQFSKKNVYETLKVLEAKFGLRQGNRQLGLAGRVRSVVTQIEKRWPLAKKVKQSFQPKQVTIVIPANPKTKSPEKKIVVKKEPPVLMNQLSKSIVEKRIKLEDKIASEAKAKQAAAENAEGGEKSAPKGGDEPSEGGENASEGGEDAPEGGEEQ